MGYDYRQRERGIGQKISKLGMKIRHVKHLTPINFAVGEHE